MKEIIIVGAGGFGREVLQWIKHINQSEATWIIKGFIDDNLSSLDGYDCDYKVLGTVKDWEVGSNEVFTCAIAIPAIKQNIVNLLISKGAVFVNVIHPTAIIGEFSSLGIGLIVTPNAKVSPNVTIKNFVTLLGSGVGHDAYIDDFSSIAGNCSVNGHVKIGKRVFVASNSCIAPTKSIGHDVWIGMGSMVISNIKPGLKVMGNPARKIDF